MHQVECSKSLQRGQFLHRRVSQHNRNVRIWGTVEMSGVRVVSLAGFEAPAIGVILGWTVLLLGAILGGAVGRTGLCRSATRAPGGRLYASRPGLLLGARAFL